MPPERLDRLPVHPIPHAISERREWALHVAGLVEHELVLTAADLAKLPRTQVQSDFRCEEGWQVERLGWRGVRLGEVLALAGPLPEAGLVRVSCGAYAVPMSMPEAADALLCDELDGQLLPVAHGGPWRLVLTTGQCFTSVKWIDQVELTTDSGERTGEEIARARIRR